MSKSGFLHDGMSSAVDDEEAFSFLPFFFNLFQNILITKDTVGSGYLVYHRKDIYGITDFFEVFKIREIEFSSEYGSVGFRESRENAFF